MKKTFAIFTSIALVWLAASAAATEFEIGQLTDNNSNDLNPSVFDDTIAWFGGASDDLQIYYWDGNTITQLTDNDQANRLPSLYDGTIAWQGEIAYKTDWEIYLSDGNTVTQVTDNNSDDAYASLYDGTIAWSGMDGNDTEIYYWDGNTTLNVSNNDTYDYFPSLYDGEIAWTGKPGVQWQSSEIYYWDGNTTTQLTQDNIRDIGPSLYDGAIAWEGDSQIYYWDGTEITQISNGLSLNTSPSLYDGKIAWRGYDGNDWEVFYWDGTDITQVTDDDMNAFTPSLHGGTIAWTAYDGQDYEVYYAESLSPPQSPPVADAGTDQSLFPNDLVALDGSGSIDPDGDTLTYQWSFAFVPAGSAVTLSDSTSVVPTFIVDVVGTYVVQLIVNDGTVNSDPDTVNITAENSPPEADAGSDQSVFANDEVVLDGSGSSDPDGDPLTYQWSLVLVPEGSSATLFDSTSVAPTFDVDFVGTYVVELVVNDGVVNSDPATVTITCENSAPEVDPGDDVYVFSEDQGDTVLYGTATDVDGDSLTYRWLEGDMELSSWQDVEEEGEANLALQDVPLFSLGEHVLTLEVSDGELTALETMVLIVENSAPQAVASGSGVYQAGDPITVGGEVLDFDGDILNYEWWLDETIQAEGQVETYEGGDPAKLPEHDLWNLDVGTHTIILQVSDEDNAPFVAYTNVEVIDTEAPTLAPKADKNILWPANHKMVEVAIEANASDNSGGSVSLGALIVSDEPEDGQGDGHTSADWTEPVIDQENGIITFGLRAERSGRGDGRVYTVTITATDEYENSASADVEILVPHDKRKGKNCRVLISKARKFMARLVSRLGRVNHEVCTKNPNHKSLFHLSRRSVASKLRGGTNRDRWGVHFRPGRGMGY